MCAAGISSDEDGCLSSAESESLSRFSCMVRLCNDEFVSVVFYYFSCGRSCETWQHRCLEACDGGRLRETLQYYYRIPLLLPVHDLSVTGTSVRLVGAFFCGPMQLRSFVCSTSCY